MSISLKPTGNHEMQMDTAARQSRFIRVISRLSHLSDTAEALPYQEKIEALHLRYSLLSLEGRLELIADLISAQKKPFSDSEQTALQLMYTTLRTRPDRPNAFLDFSLEYLSLAIQDHAHQRFCAPSRTFHPLMHTLNMRSSACQMLMALSLTGLLFSGCFQKNDQAQPSPASTRMAPGNPVCGQQTDPKTYTVQKGDSVAGIAHKMKIDAAALVQLNRLTYNAKRNWYNLHPGQVLILPIQPGADKYADAPSHIPSELLTLSKNSETGGYTYHLIKKGETLQRIAKKHRVSADSISSSNNIQNPLKIRYGSLIKIPKPAEERIGGAIPFKQMTADSKVRFLKERSIPEAHPYLKMLVETSEEFNVDPRLYAALVWEESWFDKYATSKDNCLKLIQLDPRFHEVSGDTKENFRKSLRYLKYEYTYYLKKGFDKRSSAICALAAYNGGTTRIRGFIKEGRWDGKSVESIPLKETKDYVKRVLYRCEKNYHAVL